MDISLVILGLIILLIFVKLLARKRKVAEKVSLKPIIEIHCKKCGKKSLKKKAFKVGDYVQKPYGKCSCGGQRVIAKIYVTEKSDAEKKWNKYEQKFRV